MVLKSSITDFTKLVLFQKTLLLARNLPSADLLVFKQIFIIIILFGGGSVGNYVVIHSQFDLTSFCETIKTILRSFLGCLPVFIQASPKSSLK